MGTVIIEFSDKENEVENVVTMFYFQNGRVSIEKKNQTSDKFFNAVLKWMVECKQYVDNFIDELVDIASHIYYKRGEDEDDFDPPILQYSETEQHFFGFGITIRASVKPYSCPSDKE